MYKLATTEIYESNLCNRRYFQNHTDDRRCYVKQQVLHMVFFDFEKAYDRISRVEL